VGEAEHSRKAPFAVGPEHPQHRELGAARELLGPVDALALVEEMVAGLDRAPARNRIDMERTGDQLASAALGLWILPRFAVLRVVGDELVRVAGGDAGLVVVEFNIVGEE
jgi:hypothetical protein